MKNLILILLLALSLSAAGQNTPRSTDNPVRVLPVNPFTFNLREHPSLLNETNPYPDHQQFTGLSSLGFSLIDSTIIWVWDTLNLEWKFNNKTTGFNFDGYNRITGYKTQVWEGLAWVNRARYQLSYDASGNKLSELIQEWIGNLFENSTLFSNTYDASNNLISQLGQQWNGFAWGNVIRYLYAYDTNDNQTSTIIQFWNGSNWENDSRVINTFDANNNQLSYRVQAWTGNSWQDTAQTLYSYDVDGNLLSTLFQNWVSGSWLDYVRYTSTYDGNGNLITETNEFWTGSMWFTSLLSTSSYDLNHLRINKFVQIWSGGQWHNKDYYIYSYDGNQNNNYELHQVWTGSEWVDSEESTFLFDAQNILLSEVNKFYEDDGTRIVFGDSTYNYFHQITGTESPEGENINLVVYPNPGNGKVTIRSSLPINSVRVFNLQGQPVYSNNYTSQADTYDIELSDAVKGVYFMNIYTGRELYTRRIIVQ